MNKRYEGKPLLRLIELYVLDAIGELNDVDRTRLEFLSPKLSEVYRRDGTWREILSSVMEFSESLPLRIREVWELNRSKALANGETLQPDDFAQMFVDANFAAITEERGKGEDAGAEKGGDRAG